MKKKPKSEIQDELRPEYDLRELLKHRIRGKYYKRYMEGTNLVLLDHDVAGVFHDSESVNQALRVLMKAAGQLDPTTSRKTDRA